MRYERMARKGTFENGLRGRFQRFLPPLPGAARCGKTAGNPQAPGITVLTRRVVTA